MTTPDIVTFVVPDRTRAIGSWILYLPVGSLHDPPGKEGLCYLTGQMLLRGAASRDHAAFTDELDFLGSSLSVGVGRERTSVSGDALTRNLHAFEGLVRDLLTEPRFEAAELDKLRRQTKADLAHVRDNDGALGQRFYSRALFETHPYSRPLKGTEATLDAITIDDVRRFYGEHFGRDDLIAAAAGDVDAARLEAFVERTTAPLPAQSPRPVAVPPRVTEPGYRVVLVDKPERSQTQCFVGQLTASTSTPDYFPLLVGQTIFGGTFTSRLSHEIREKRGWSYGAYSFLSTDRHLGTFTLRFYPSVADTVPALELADALFRALVDEGVTAEEVAFAKSYLANGHAFSIDTAERRLSELLGAHLQRRPADFVDTFVARVEAVTRDEVVDAIRRHLTPDRLVAAIVATASTLGAALDAWGRPTSMETVDYRAVPYP